MKHFGINPDIFTTQKLYIQHACIKQIMIIESNESSNKYDVPSYLYTYRYASYLYVYRYDAGIRRILKTN